MECGDSSYDALYAADPRGGYMILKVAARGQLTDKDVDWVKGVWGNSCDVSDICT
ncbi:hypothetical protein Lfu02_80350 [Longispora fulva]|nr:hypothetical protein Lfu02_80350 [Longispora fulva]